MAVYTGTKLLQTILVQVVMQAHWLNFRKRQTWFVHVVIFCFFFVLFYV